MRGKTLSIGDAIAAALRGTGLEQVVLETAVVEQWPQVMGPLVARLTRKIEVRDGVLYVHLSSAALKAQLFENRFQLVEKLNAAVGGQAIRDVRLMG